MSLLDKYSNSLSSLIIIFSGQFEVNSISSGSNYILLDLNKHNFFKTDIQKKLKKHPLSDNVSNFFMTKIPNMSM